MFKRRTLFILGAGASKEVRLPLGSELAEIIYAKLNLMSAKTHGDKRLLETLTWYARDGNVYPYLSAAQDVADSFPLLHSIDDFIENHQASEFIQFVGKLAIVKSIMDAEEASPLYGAGVDRRGDAHTGFFDAASPELRDTWFVKFARIFGEGASQANLFDRVSFITFNYDRTLETFLLWTIVRLLRLRDVRDAAALLDQAYICHPHGSMGRLMPLRPDDRDYMPFGRYRRVDIPPQEYVAMSSRIRTYSQLNAAAGDLACMREKVAAAERIIFLGFGFHPHNMELLTPSNCNPDLRVFATTFGMNQEECRQAIHRMTNGIEDIVLDDLTCAGLFDRYRRGFDEAVIRA